MLALEAQDAFQLSGQSLCLPLPYQLSPPGSKSSCLPANQTSP